MDAPRTEFVIAETSTSTWHYHLRRVVSGLLYVNGGAPPALCGRPLGWDTKIRLSAWGAKSHIPQTWCSRCADEAARLGVMVGRAV